MNWKRNLYIHVLDDQGDGRRKWSEKSIDDDWTYKMNLVDFLFFWTIKFHWTQTNRCCIDGCTTLDTTIRTIHYLDSSIDHFISTISFTWHQVLFYWILQDFLLYHSNYLVLLFSLKHTFIKRTCSALLISLIVQIFFLILIDSILMFTASVNRSIKVIFL